MNTKIALITGGSRGLGRDTAIKLAKNGIDTIITYNSDEKSANQVAADIFKLNRKCVVLKLDVSDSKSFDDFVVNVKKSLKEVWSRDSFNFLINNAGKGINASITETTEEQFEEMMKIHLKAPFFLTKKLLSSIVKGGRIINVSSGLTRFSFSGHASYAIMKAGVETLTRYMAVEFGSLGITVNTIAPGAIETDFGGGLVRDNSNVNKHIALLTALGRVGIPEDISGVMAMLCSEEAGWINGQRIEASGGIFL